MTSAIKQARVAAKKAKQKTKTTYHMLDVVPSEHFKAMFSPSTPKVIQLIMDDVLRGFYKDTNAKERRQPGFQFFDVELTSPNGTKIDAVVQYNHLRKQVFIGFPSDFDKAA